MRKGVSDIAGWYGVLAILLAYGLNSFGIIMVSSLGYLVLNLTGAVGIMFEALVKRDYQPVVLNIVWALIALVAIARLVF